MTNLNLIINDGKIIGDHIHNLGVWKKIYEKSKITNQKLQIIRKLSILLKAFLIFFRKIFISVKSDRKIWRP